MRKLSEVSEQATRRTLLGCWVSLPARIESYDHQTQRASVKPLLRRQDGESRPVITGVPVMFPRSADASITFPIKPGDGVLLIFSDRSLDLWLARGGEVTPDDPRAHSYNDAIAIPGLYPFTEQSPAENNDDLLVRRGAIRLRLKADGTVEIVSGGVTIASDLTVQGTVTASGDVVGGGISLQNHTHGGVQGGGSNTGPAQ